MYSTRSLGFATDLMLASLDGEISCGEGYIAARTPSCPLFWWGNFVLFSDPPAPGKIETWEGIFDREVGRVDGVRHRNLAWDATRGEQGAAASFTSRGYTLTRHVFLTTDAATPSVHQRNDAEVRPIRTADEWRRALEIEHESQDPGRRAPVLRALQTQQMRRNQMLTARGCGTWFGAFAGKSMVATMGLFVKKGLARCQGVATAPAYRRQGYCSTLVHAVCSYGFTQMGAQTVVIMTSPDSQAARIYESVGFTLRERVSSLSVSFE